MKIFNWCCEFDEHLIDKVFQPAADWLHEVTGRSCFWWGAKFLELSATIAVITQIYQIAFTTWDVLGALICLIYSAWLVRLAMTFKRTPNGPNPWRHIWLAARMIFLLGLIVLAVADMIKGRWMAPDQLTLVIGFYLVACRSDGGALFRRYRTVPQGAS